MSRFEDSSSIRRGKSFERSTYQTKNSRNHRICHERTQKNSNCFTLDALAIFVANHAMNLALRGNYGGTRGEDSILGRP